MDAHPGTYENDSFIFLLVELGEFDTEEWQSGYINCDEVFPTGVYWFPVHIYIFKIYKHNPYF